LKTFDVQSIELEVPGEQAFAYLADPARLPEWTSAFARVEGGRARLRTPAGETEIDLAVQAHAEAGTVDWKMGFGDGSIAMAYSRLVPSGVGRCIYSFVLMAPPVPLEQLEGALAEQSRTLAEELGTLRRVLKRHG